MKIDDTWYPPSWRGRPASMPWSDWQIWQRWIVSELALYERYAYDVLLDVAPVPSTVIDPAMRRMWRENTAKRIDAVGRRGDASTIIEVRELATWQTIGQVLGYQTLAELQYSEELWTRPLIVTGGVALGVEPAIRAQHITLALV